MKTQAPVTISQVGNGVVQMRHLFDAIEFLLTEAPHPSEFGGRNYLSTVTGLAEIGCALASEVSDQVHQLEDAEPAGKVSP